MKALGLSVELALISTFICLVLAYPLCLILRERKESRGLLVFLLFLLPLWMNSLLTTMAWQTILEKHGLINMFLQSLGLPEVHIINTPLAIIIGMVYNFLPYMVLPLYVAINRIDSAFAPVHARYCQWFHDGVYPRVDHVRHQCVAGRQQGFARG